MKLSFDLSKIIATEFGVASKRAVPRIYQCVPIDASVQLALRGMADRTWELVHYSEEPHQGYDPANNYASSASLRLPLGHALASEVRELHDADNVPIQARRLDDPAEISIYFARFVDEKRRRLTAMRRAAQFKGVLKSKDRLIRLIDDTLQMIDDNVFKLDGDFDLIADSSNVHILHPVGFESIADIQQAVLDAVPDNLREIAAQVDFVEFDNIAEYASRHPRAARYIASIRGQAEGIDKSALRNLCASTHVATRLVKGKLFIEPGSELAFLEVLDRRRYEIDLVKERPEQYRAGNRTKING